MTRSQILCKIGIVILALSLVISLILIIVGAIIFSDKTSARQCPADLQILTEMVEEGRANQTRQHMEMERFLKRFGKTSVSLDDCQQESVILGGNIAVLKKEIEMHKNIEADLTLLQEHIKLLQENLTQVSHKWESCKAFHSAADSESVNGGVAAPQSSILALATVLFVSLHLIT